MTPYQAVELASWCREISYDSGAPEESKYYAIRWCNAAGECLVGYGPTALDAVIDVTRKCRYESTKRGY